MPSPEPPLALHDIPDGTVAVFSCATCAGQVALKDELVSKSFSGREGRAYLLNTAFSITPSKAEERVLLTGKHSVADVSCTLCGQRLGWRYERAEASSQKYKEGKYILEKERIIKDNGWVLELEDD